MIGLCTDSNAQLPGGLADRYGVEVVPLTVTVGRRSFLEGVELGADSFWEMLRQGPVTVTTAAPGPGRFAAAYAALAARGARAVLSVHVGAEVSATLQSARLAAADAPVPVRLVDTGTASFGVACCLWEAAEALGQGASVEEAAATAEAVAGRLGNVFVVGATELARRGGRVDPTAARSLDEGVTLLSLVGGRMVQVGRVPTLGDAAPAMAAHIVAAGKGLRVGVGVADAGAAAMSGDLEARLARAPAVKELVRYRIGASVGAHTGPGTAGAYFYAQS